MVVLLVYGDDQCYVDDMDHVGDGDEVVDGRSLVGRLKHGQDLGKWLSHETVTWSGGKTRNFFWRRDKMLEKEGVGGARSASPNGDNDGAGSA